MRASAWRQEMRLWVPALILLVLNATAFAAYQAFFADEARSRESQVGRGLVDLERLTTQRELAEQLASRAQQNRDRLVRFYDNRLKTEEQRVTKVISEVKGLATQAGLNPPTIRYPDEALTEFGLVKRSIVFGVEGSYLSLRKFINFLELTHSFLTLEEIRPGDQSRGGRKRLSIDLKISTLFLDADVEPAALASSRETVSDAE